MLIDKILVVIGVLFPFIFIAMWRYYSFKNDSGLMTGVVISTLVGYTYLLGYMFEQYGLFIPLVMFALFITIMWVLVSEKLKKRGKKT